MIFDDPLLNGGDDLLIGTERARREFEAYTLDVFVNGPTADAAQTLADAREILRAQLEALDDYINEVAGPAFAPVGGIPVSSPEASVDPISQPYGYNLLEPEPEGHVPGGPNSRGVFGNFAAAVDYVAKGNLWAIAKIYRLDYGYEVWIEVVS